MTKPYEVPTDELRQVKKRLYSRDSILGPGRTQSVANIETTIQRKWLISLDQPEYSGAKQGENDIDVSPDQSALVWVPGIAEWRDIPVVHEGDWPAQAQ